MGKLFASADIGSNTVHLLVAQVQPNGLQRVVNESVWLSLGEVVSRTGTIPTPDRIRLIETLTRFRNICQEYKCEKFYVFATEAMRRADNHDAILGELRTKHKVPVEIISPQREAALSVLAAGIDCPGPDPWVMAEAGGGSVQVAWVEQGSIQHEISLPLGTGVLTAQSGLRHPASAGQIAAIEERIDAEIARFDLGIPQRIVACGGVIRGLWRALHPDGDRVLHRRELEFLAWDTQRLRPEQTVSRYGVKLKRAETLLPGSILFQRLLTKFGQDTLTVSQYGVREGAILEMVRGAEEWLT